MRFVTWNLEKYGKSGTVRERARQGRIVEMLAGWKADVIAVQEIACHLDGFLELAEQLEMHCLVPMGDGMVEFPALDPGRRGLGMGLMWRPDITPVPDSLQVHSRDRFMHHGMCVASLTIDGLNYAVGSGHLSPHLRNLRVDEGDLVARAFRRSWLGIIGLDITSVDATRTRDGTYFDPDPFAGLLWRDEFAPVCQWDDGDGRPGNARHWADRRAGEALTRGGLHDLTVASGAEWAATQGHDTAYHPGTGVPLRADMARGTRPVADAATATFVDNSVAAQAVSDHAPVVTDIGTELL